MDFVLFDAKLKRDEYIKTFIEYCNVLVKDDLTLNQYDYQELAKENLDNINDDPNLILVDGMIAGLVVFSKETANLSEHSCHTYINEIYIKKEYQHNGLATGIVLSYLKSLKYDTGLCYVVGSPAERFWFNLLGSHGYKYKIYKEDKIRNFIHINIV